MQAWKNEQRTWNSEQQDKKIQAHSSVSTLNVHDLKYKDSTNRIEQEEQRKKKIQIYIF